MRKAFAFVLLASALPAIQFAYGQTTSTPSTTSQTTTGAAQQQTRSQLCENPPCEDPDQQRDMRTIHTQDMDWLDGYGPAAGPGGGPGTSRNQGQHGTGAGQGQGPGSGAGAGHQGPGPH